MQVAGLGQPLRLKIVCREVEFQVVINQAKPNTVEPTRPPEQILVYVFIGKEINQ